MDRIDVMPELCVRCHTNKPCIMSRFNVDWICGECETKEKAHPEYPRAAAAELAAVKRGEYNYPGIGKPADL
jgi:hypothetical protein